MQRIYLDANATTPLDPRVRDTMRPWLDCGNASSPHAEGRTAREAVDRARDQVARLVGAAPREVLFTSGATEANAIALLGTIHARTPARVFCSAVEHPSVLRTLEALRPGVALTVGAVDRNGRLAPLDFPPDTGLVSLMLANNETGTLQPVKETAARAREAGAVMHTDAVQACGKVPVDFRDLAVDLLTLSAHKMHGPKGAGAVVVRRGTRLEPLYHGGEHERALRPGTENVAAIVGLGAAADLARKELASRRELWSRLRDLFRAGLDATIPDVRVNTPPDSVPNTISLTIPGVEGEAVLLGLDLEGIAVATGSACSSGAAEPSHVLRAMGLGDEEVDQSIRVSFHSGSCEEDVKRCLDTLARVVKNLRALHV